MLRLKQHPRLWLAAFAFVGVGMRAYLPCGQDVAELTVEQLERGFDFLRRQPAACDSRLVGHDEHQMVVKWAELFRHAGQQFYNDIAVSVERNFARVVTPVR